MARPNPRALLDAVPASRPAVRGLAVIGVISGVVALAQAAVLAWAVTMVATGGSMTTPLLVLAALLVARGALAGLGEYAARRAGHAAASEVRSRVLRRWLALPQERRPDGDDATALIGEGVAAIEPYVAKYVPALITAAVVPALAVLTLLFVDVWSAVIVLLTLPLLPVFAALIGLHTRDQTQQRWAAMSQLSGHFLDVVRGLPTLVAYGRAEKQVDVVRDVGERHRRATVTTLRTAFLSTAALELLATISVAMVAVAVGLRLAYGTMELQVGLTAILLAPEAYWPIRRVGSEFHNAADGVETLDALSEHLADFTDESKVTEEVSMALGDRVAVAGVTFAYPNRYDVLHDLSLQTALAPGLTCLTGPSGTGKTTLLEVLSGIRLPQAGTVSCPTAHLATQRPLLVAGTVLDNLRLVEPDLSEEGASHALAQVGLLDALERRSGLYTYLGDDGFGLSAGQRSRLALARARLSRDEIVLLDEPMAHIAETSMPIIYAAIAEMAKTRRVIAATHDDGLVAASDSRWQMSAVNPPEAASSALGAAVSTLGVTETSAYLSDAAAHEATVKADPPHPSIAAVGLRDEPATTYWQRRSPRTRLVLATLMGGLSVASGVALTATSGWLIVQASFQPVVLTLLVAIVGVRTFGLARPVLRYGERVVSHDVALATLARRRAEVYQRLIPLTPARLGRRSRSDFLTAVVRDLDDVVDEKVRVTVPWWSTAIATAVAVAVIGVALPWAGLMVLIGGLAAFGVGRVVFAAECTAQREAVAARGEVLGVATTLTQQIDAVRAVAGHRSPHLVIDLDAPHDAQGQAETRLVRARAVGIAAAWLVVAAITIGVGVLAAGAFTAGTLGAPMAALVALTPMALADAWVSLPEVCGARARARAAQARLDEVLDQSTAVSMDVQDLDLPATSTPVTLSAISASWSAGTSATGSGASDGGDGGNPDWEPLDPDALDVDSLDLGPLHTGDRLVVTGPNGAGKSTALAVLARHLDPVAGTYEIGSTDVQDVSVASVRARIALVDDEPHAFAGTVRANLALAHPGSDDAQMTQALHAVDLGRWLAGLPQKLDTPIGGVSGGERARLSMARAVLSQRPIILLDEPTAHLDDATAARALDGLSDRHTNEPIVVAVSHRPLPWTGFTTVTIGAREPAMP